MSRYHNNREDARREILIERLAKLFQKYGKRGFRKIDRTVLTIITVELLKSTRELARLSPSSNHDCRSVSEDFEETQPPCVSESYIYRKEDIITLKSGFEVVGLMGLLEESCKSLRTRSCK